MTRRPWLSLVLAAALLAGQWLAAAHQPDHALQPEHACAVCLYAHDAGGGALPSVPHVEVEGALVAPDAPAAASPLAAILRHYPIRGPPALLV